MYDAGNLLGIILACLLITMTIIGNMLVMIAVLLDRHLRQSKTNYFIFSLAVADLLLGVVVMPFATYDYLSPSIIVNGTTGEQTMKFWPFGHDWCDMWHAFDVLSSTASILNLCAISLERFCAISNPISYPSKMTRCKCLIIIAGIWLCSSLISFPAIKWWRYYPVIEKTCIFPSDKIYLILSSCISFYIPLIFMIVIYAKIYKTAINLVRTLQSGSRILCKDKLNGEDMILRIHRGGQTKKDMKHLSSPYRKPTQNSNELEMAVTPSITYRKSESYNFDEVTLSEPSTQKKSFCHEKKKIKCLLPRRTGLKHFVYNFEFYRRVKRFVHEQKAAKTLGIVMGVFIVCWLPFFITNTAIALDKDVFGKYTSIVFLIVTWLGYINSGMNPLIYAYSMSEFRIAFIRIICCNRRSTYNRRMKKMLKLERSHRLNRIDYRLRLASNYKSSFVRKNNDGRCKNHLPHITNEHIYFEDLSYDSTSRKLEFSSNEECTKP